MDKREKLISNAQCAHVFAGVALLIWSIYNHINGIFNIEFAIEELFEHTLAMYNMALHIFSLVAIIISLIMIISKRSNILCMILWIFGLAPALVKVFDLILLDEAYYTDIAYILFYVSKLIIVIPVIIFILLIIISKKKRSGLLKLWFIPPVLYAVAAVITHYLAWYSQHIMFQGVFPYGINLLFDALLFDIAVTAVLLGTYLQNKADTCNEDCATVYNTERKGGVINEGIN